MVSHVALLHAALLLPLASAFAPPHSSAVSTTKLFVEAAANDVNHRRKLFQAVVVGGFGIVTPLASFAASTDPPTKEELHRIKVGYDGIRYLLDNFEKETTVCRENGGECKRDAEPVRRYMGLRSTTDPLFQIEKVFDKVKNMDDVDLEQFFEATEDWNTAVNMSNSMAFISQFGEYNPGGGKDEVLKYLNESQKQVVLAETALKKMIEILNIT